ncbi:hypothetical protein EMIHUDRAFT_227551 [Emiliania huxleyi CCMP1516]|uniref:C3H1-type domain-containing protein n=2 Tax=Emiliania huxleyi TaxID=2903 RepID=A0A0D3KHL5_EMIH1|nr:hypothetical protein EMIHUDRAFT_227551 [Emiliania huxleyi CCMP1516]EOD35250.1 hypothetical protein EMIHUDRAFT_227551 [Emiliania huxleyi CCMP1516]|eukprot:XP_005787679.1 hypothetical protein EMIHUDRAFT_227551 [Emiliania huxleyi CCMP1516]
MQAEVSEPQPKPSVEGAGFDRQPDSSVNTRFQAYKGGHNFGLSQATTECYTDIADERREPRRRYMVDFNESEGESAFLVVRSTRGVWFDNPHVFHRSLAKVPISFCFAPEKGGQVQTELGSTASVKAGIMSLPPSLLGAEACGVNNDVVVKEEAATQEAASEEAVEAVAEEAAKEVEKPAKTVSNTPDPADTTCHPGLPTPKEVGQSGPASARSGSGPGYVDGVEAEVRRLGESVVYQATPADGKKSPSPGVPTSFGVAPKPLGAVAGAGQADAASREYYLAVRDKAMAAILLTKMQRAKLDAERSGCGCKCRRKAMRCRNNPTFGKGRRKSGKAGGRRKSGKAKGRGRGSHRRPKPRGGPQTPPCKSPDRRREPQTTSGKAPFAAGTCGAGAGTCGAGGRAGLKAAADCVRGGYTKAEGAFRWLLLVCIPAFGHCAPAVPSPTEVASAFSSAVASAASVASSASSTFSSGVASAASSAFSPAVASKASSLVSCSPLLVPALVLILLAIACGASWPTAASGKGARGAVWATCLAAATACLTSAAAAPAGFFASAFSWLAAGPPKVAAAVAAGTAMWRRNSKARRFGWSSLLSVLLCLATVAGSSVTVTGGAALVASSTALPDVTALPASPVAIGALAIGENARDITIGDVSNLFWGEAVAYVAVNSVAIGKNATGISIGDNTQITFGNSSGPATIGALAIGEHASDITIGDNSNLVLGEAVAYVAVKAISIFGHTRNVQIGKHVRISVGDKSAALVIGAGVVGWGSSFITTGGSSDVTVGEAATSISIDVVAIGSRASYITIGDSSDVTLGDKSRGLGIGAVGVGWGSSFITTGGSSDVTLGEAATFITINAVAIGFHASYIITPRTTRITIGDQAISVVIGTFGIDSYTSHITMGKVSDITIGHAVNAVSICAGAIGSHSKNITVGDITHLTFGNSLGPPPSSPPPPWSPPPSSPHDIANLTNWGDALNPCKDSDPLQKFTFPTFGSLGTTGAGSFGTFGLGYGNVDISIGGLTNITVGDGAKNIAIGNVVVFNMNENITIGKSANIAIGENAEGIVFNALKIGNNNRNVFLGDNPLYIDIGSNCNDVTFGGFGNIMIGRNTRYFGGSISVGDGATNVTIGKSGDLAVGDNVYKIPHTYGGIGQNAANIAIGGYDQITIADYTEPQPGTLGIIVGGFYIGDDAKDVTIGGYSAVFVGCLTWNASNCVEFVNKQLTTFIGSKASSVSIGRNAEQVTIGHVATDIVIGHEASNVYLGNNIFNVSLGNNVSNIVICDNATDIVLGDNTANMVLGDSGMFRGFNISLSIAHCQTHQTGIDLIRCTLGFDVVSSFSLADPSAKAAFLSLATATATVTLTPTHKLPAGPAKALKQASEVAVGETVWLASPAAGTLITKVVADGLHSPLTMHGGWPIVDGVATSYNSAAVVARNKYLVPLVEAACPSLGRLVVAAVNPKPMHYIDGEVVEPIASLEVAAAVAVTVIARDPKAKCANGSGCKYIHDGTGATPTPMPADPLADRIAAAKAAIAPGTPPSLGKRAKPPTPDSSDDL